MNIADQEASDEAVQTGYIVDINQAARELCLDYETVREFIVLFLEDGEQEYLFPITAALEQKDFENLKKEAHRLKGAALNLRLVQIGNYAQELEGTASGGNAEACSTLVHALRKVFRYMKKALK